MNNISLSVALATAPSSAFEELRARPRFWFPLLLLVASTLAMMFWYYSIVDVEWFKDAMFGSNPDVQKLPEDQRASMMGMYTRNTLLWGSMIGILFAMPIIFLVSALYLLLAARITKLPQDLRFKHWFAFACWTALPTLLSNVIAGIMLVISDTTQVSPSALAPLSINALVFQVPMSGAGYSLLESLTIPNFLGWALMIIGVHVWTQRSWAFSALFVIVPAVVIYGVWAFLAFR
ncbi:MAG: YIP1 family protein [Steroidobacteraceae bacterium]|nr:YIP1 family protein [Steroidobacteraceae bacterium]